MDYLPGDKPVPANLPPFAVDFQPWNGPYADFEFVFPQHLINEVRIL
jgi:hypothetical protein